MAERLDISVIIVSYNNQKLLTECLDSVRKNIKKISYEVFVVDNASADDSVKVLQRDYPWVNLLVNKQNLGFARANNQALAKAKGRHLVLLNNDTLVLPNCFEPIVDFLDNNLLVGALSPKLLESDGKTVQPPCCSKRCHYISSESIHNSHQCHHA